jgi:hypothetical protein
MEVMVAQWLELIDQDLSNPELLWTDTLGLLM